MASDQLLRLMQPIRSFDLTFDFDYNSKVSTTEKRFPAIAGSTLIAEIDWTFVSVLNPVIAIAPILLSF